MLESLETGKRLKPCPSLPDNITLKTKLRALIPEDFALADEHATAHATLEDALGHRLGVGANDSVYGGEGYTVRDAVRALRHLPMVAELREKQEYLNMGYMVIQHVVETLTGKPIEESHREYIWGPLGMDSTYPSLQEAKDSGKQLCAGYIYDPLAKKIEETAHVNDYPLIGGGGVISSIRDMTAYLHGVMHSTLPLGKDYQEKLLTPLSLDDPGTPVEHWSHGLYCLGWSQQTYRGRRIVSHNGGINGFNSQLLYLPDAKWGMAVLSNSSHGLYAWHSLKLRLLDDVLRVPPAERQPSPEDELSDKLEGSGRHLSTARETIYPHVPDPPLPLSLPLSCYAGTYTGNGPKTLELTVASPRATTPVRSGVTEVLRTEFTALGDFVYEMEHVSGEFFLGWKDFAVPAAAARAARRVQFVLGADGSVARVGINFAPATETGDDLKMTWFDKA